MSARSFPDWVEAMAATLASPPAFYNGTLYVGLAQSERHIQGGLVAAIDGATSRIWGTTRRCTRKTLDQRPGPVPDIRADGK
jgi:hypothetical protein